MSGFMVGHEDEHPAHPGHGNGIFSLRLWYPAMRAPTETVEIGLNHVRSADGIRVSYDFDQDGWVVQQQIHYHHSEGAPYCVEGPWVEVAFIKAWGLEEVRP